MAKSVLHVVPHNNDWAVKREGNERASSTHPTQKEAIDSARELAKELDDIVIHRADGTIRERVTYYGTNGQAQTSGTESAPAPRTDGGFVVEGFALTTSGSEKPRAEDLLGVRSRVSWQAVLAGAVIAVAAYIVLSLLALAIGVSIADRTSSRVLTVSAAITSGVILLISMFVGGLVASRTTAGENTTESAIYGVLVWGAVTLGLVAWGMSLAANSAAAIAQTAPGRTAPVNAAPSADRVKTELGLSEQQAQHYAELAQQRQTVTQEEATKAAWLTFGAVALSLLAAIGGALMGRGEEVAVRRVRDNRPAVAVVPQPA